MEKLYTDVLIIGGGTAGCFAGITLAKESNLNVLILEKAHIKRSGCLAAGVNAINAYITKGHEPKDYVDYAGWDAKNIVRKDLLLSMAKGLNSATQQLEGYGLAILKDENGEYVARGKRNIKINGENIKPILASEVAKYSNIKVKNKTNCFELIVENGQVFGAYAIGLDNRVLYQIHAKRVICATGGASGLYRPNNPGSSRHKMWYSPFNTGAGYAMGILAGAEMTTFEMRFVALRCKDTIAPTGTLAQGVGAGQINGLGENYESNYGIRTCERVYGTLRENQLGKGPCYLKTKGISREQDTQLMKAYLNMAPGQTLRWIENDSLPSKENVEIEGTEPYIVGGHTASGYWVDVDRQTTIKGLYAAGDVAGGAPQKYVTGALVEGELAARAIIKSLEQSASSLELKHADRKGEEKWNEILALFDQEGEFLLEQIEEGMQKIMDQYAGGISTGYSYSLRGLEKADQEIKKLTELTKKARIQGFRELVMYFELKERLVVCSTVIAHLQARKESRWKGFGEYLDHPSEESGWEKYVNSIYKDGKVEILYRDLM